MELVYIFTAIAVAAIAYFIYDKVKNRNKESGGRQDYGDPKPPQQER